MMFNARRKVIDEVSGHVLLLQRTRFGSEHTLQLTAASYSSISRPNMFLHTHRDEHRYTPIHKNRSFRKGTLEVVICNFLKKYNKETRILS